MMMRMNEEIPKYVYCQDIRYHVQGILSRPGAGDTMHAAGHSRLGCRELPIAAGRPAGARHFSSAIIIGFRVNVA